MSSDRKRLLASGALFAITLLVFEPVRHHDFVAFDDNAYVTDNPHLRKRDLGREGLRWAFFQPYEANWIPLTWLSFELDHALFGVDPGGYHVTNALLHAASAALLLWVLAGATGALGPSAFAAGVFALHPLHVESVAWVAERKDVLSGLFFVLTLGAWCAYARRPGALRYALALLCFGLGLLAKSVGVTVPLLLLLLDAWPLGRARSASSLRRACLEKLPFLAISAAIAVVTYRVQQKMGAMSTLDGIPLGVRVENALVSYLVYLRQAVWPARLAVFYPHLMRPLPAWQWLGAAALLALLTAGALAVRRSRPWLAVGWLWYVGLLVPMIGLVQVGLQAHADRYMYLPLIGLSIAVGWEGAARLPKGSTGRVAGAAIGGLVLVALAAATRVQLGYWRDTEALFQHAVAVTRDNFVAHQGIGQARLQRGDLDGALEATVEAVRIRADWSTRTALGDVLAKQGKLDEALWNYGEAVRDKPDSEGTRLAYGRTLEQRGWHDEALEQYGVALALDEQVRGGARAGWIYALIGDAWGARGQAGRAAEAYERALARDPDLTEVRAKLALARLDTADPAEVVRTLEASLAGGVDWPELHFGMADALGRLGREAEAIDQYEAGLRSRPDSKEAANNLAWLLATANDRALRNPAEGLRWAERAAEANGRRDASVLDTLAVCQAANGRFDDAVATIDAAVAAATDPKLADELRAHRALFAAHRPFEPAVSEGAPMRAGSP